VTPSRWARLASVALFGMARAALAEDACAVDARRLCPDVPYGEGRVVDCLRARWYEVSSACQQTIQRVDNKARQVDVACTNDVYQHCRRVPSGGGRVLSCLVSQWEHLLPACRDAVGEVAERARKLTTACASDAERLCPGIEPGGGRIFACLKLQERAVSSRCGEALRP
jgi:cysteine rich repeat protein